MNKRLSILAFVAVFLPTAASADDGLSIRVLLPEGIKNIPVERYVEGVVSGEMPSGWPAEAQKAQAVAARTYAYYMMREKAGDAYDVQSTIEDQVYSKTANPNAGEAAVSTAGELLAYHGKPIKARFHSTCGGRTETSIHVWNEADVTQSSNDPYCAASPHSSWKVILTPDKIAGRLKKHGFDPGRITAIEPVEFEESGRAAVVLIRGDNQTISLTGNDFRRFIGFKKIKSTYFTVAGDGRRFLFAGRGFGHGVGMCQWGAKGMAEAGFTYRDILKFYYPGTEVVRMTHETHRF